MNRDFLSLVCSAD